MVYVSKMTIYVQNLQNELFCITMRVCGSNGRSLKGWISENHGIPLMDLVLYYNGRIVREDDELEEDGVYHISVRLRGGKGGFGSMLRRIGAQIEKTTNHEACRDLSGRRMRDVNNEKKLGEWISKQAEKEAEMEERRRAKLERMKAGPRHIFVDPNYDKQKKEVLENLEDAVTSGLEASADVPSSSGVKRKAGDDAFEEGSKAAKLWIGVDYYSEEDSDEDVHPSHDLTDDQQNQELQTQDDTTVPSEIKKSSFLDTKLGGSPTLNQEFISNTQGNTFANANVQSDNIIQDPLPVDKDSKEGVQVVNGKHKEEVSSEQNTQSIKQLVLEEIMSPGELHRFGLEVLKSELMSRGLKCGGTLEERAARLFAVKGLSPEEIDSSHKAKPKRKK